MKDSKRLRTLILLTDAFGGRGGIATYNRYLIKGVSEYPLMDNIVALPRKAYYKPESIPENLNYEWSASKSKFRYLISCIKLIFSVRSFDLILCSHLHLLPLAWLMSLRYNCPIVPIVYGRDSWTPTPYCLVNYLSSRIQTFITIRHMTAKRFIAWSEMLKPNYHYLPNCIDPEKYGIAPPRVDLISRYNLHGKTVIMTSGRLDSGDDLRKGFDEVLEVLTELRRQVPNLVYLIMGDGEDKYRLETKAMNLGVDDITIFTGYISEEEKADYYRLADAFVMPGSNHLFDSYPYRFVFLEALACGVPVVGVQLVEEYEINDPDTEMIIQVDPNNPMDIIRGIKQALSLKPNSVSAILKKYYYDAYRKNLHAILDKIIFK